MDEEIEAPVDGLEALGDDDASDEDNLGDACSKNTFTVGAGS